MPHPLTYVTFFFIIYSSQVFLVNVRFLYEIFKLVDSIFALGVFYLLSYLKVFYCKIFALVSLWIFKGLR